MNNQELAWIIQWDVDKSRRTRSTFLFGGEIDIARFKIWTEKIPGSYSGRLPIWSDHSLNMSEVEYSDNHLRSYCSGRDALQRLVVTLLNREKANELGKQD